MQIPERRNILSYLVICSPLRHDTWAVTGPAPWGGPCCRGGLPALRWQWPALPARAPWPTVLGTAAAWPQNTPNACPGITARSTIIILVEYCEDMGQFFRLMLIVCCVIKSLFWDLILTNNKNMYIQKFQLQIGGPTYHRFRNPSHQSILQGEVIEGKVVIRITVNSLVQALQAFCVGHFFLCANCCCSINKQDDSECI